LLFADVFLFILVQQIQQVDVPPNLQIQIQLPESAAFTLAATGIGGTSLADPAQARNDRASVRLCRQFLLHHSQDCVRVFTRQLVQPPRKGTGFDKYHKVLYTTPWEICQGLLSWTSGAENHTGQFLPLIDRHRIHFHG
jgi:hypothetical protein